MRFDVLTPTFPSTRASMHRVGAHVLGRRRHALSGRFGLRSTPGGFGTPAAGPDHEVVRLRGTRLVREIAGDAPATSILDLSAATLRAAAAHVAVDLDAPFSVGRDTPALGDVDAALVLDEVAAAALADWFDFGWDVLDDVLAALGAAAQPSVIQLWPEHFDAGCDVLAASGERVNLGASPGDAQDEGPYVYVGPWSPERPGDPDFWNAPFGARLGRDALRAVDDPQRIAVDFCLRGLALLAG